MNDQMSPPVLKAESWPLPRTCPFSPPEEYTPLREAAGLPAVTLPSGRTVWVAGQHEHVRALLADARFSSDRLRPDFPRMRPGEVVQSGFRASLVQMDPPEHDQARRPLLGEFTMRRMAEFQPRVQEIVDGRIDAMLAGPKPVDLISALSLPMSGLVICDLLGIPAQDREHFTGLTQQLVRTDLDEATQGAVFGELIGFLDALVTGKEADPPDDLLGRLVRYGRTEEGPHHQSLVELCVLLLVAGLETTATMTALGVLALLEHPEQLAVITRDPGRTPDAVEELLRMFTVAEASLLRLATEDVELGGTLVRAGDGVAALAAAANRDPRVFTDPDTFDLDRDNRRHLAFGSGRHQCLGKNLARLELRTAFDTLFRRIPGLRLAIPLEDLEFVNAAAFSLRELPVTW